MLLIATLALAGCDMITGAGEQKNRDAEAIGYACRVSLKAPETCMKENEAQSPTSILKGWKDAEKDIAEEAIDPTMGNKPAPVAHSAPAPVENENKAAAEKAVEKTGVAKGEKPAASAAKHDKSAVEKKPEH
jgi:hypothetical protein